MSQIDEAAALTLAQGARGLFQNAQVDLADRMARAALVQDPLCVPALALRADIARRCGDLKLAAETFQRLTALDGESIFLRHAASVYGGGEPEAVAPELLTVSPFVRREDWMPITAREEVFEKLCACLKDREGWSAGEVWTSKQFEVQSQVRIAAVVRDTTRLEEMILPRVRRLLPEILPKLGMEVFEAGEIEMQAIHQGPGGFYRPHRDTGWPEIDGGHSDQRRVSFVAYFHVPEKAFAGGELRLYDGNPRSGVHGANYVQLTPKDNSIVFFPSVNLHEVVPVVMDPDRPAWEGRFGIAGWVHKAKS